MEITLGGVILLVLATIVLWKLIGDLFCAVASALVMERPIRGYYGEVTDKLIDAVEQKPKPSFWSRLGRALVEFGKTITLTISLLRDYSCSDRRPPRDRG